MHVCRQIRAEFRQQYMCHPIRVDYHDATEYVQTFYPTRPVFLRDTEQLPGDIQIDMYEVSKINLAPLLYHLFRLPRIHFEFGYRPTQTEGEPHEVPYLPARIWPEMNLLFMGHAQAWKKHLGTNIGQISFFAWHDSRFSEEAVEHMEVHFRAHTPGIWGYDGVSGPLRPILEELGLQGLQRLKLCVRMFLGN
jgi:hypothetical protein